MRSFVGLALPHVFREALAEAGSAIRDTDPRWVDAKWVPAQNLHITLQFLGQVEAEALDRLGEHLAQEVDTSGAVATALTGLRPVPRVERVRMIWATFEDESGRLASISEQVGKIAGLHGIETETKPFTAHVTLVRARRPAPLDPKALTLAEQGLRSALGQNPVMSVAHATLYKSTLTRAGAVYEELRDLPFDSIR